MKIILSTLALTCLLAVVCVAQWVQTNGPEGGNVGCIAAMDTNVFVGAGTTGVFHSSDNGTSWTSFNTGLPRDIVFALSVSGTNLFAGTSGHGVWRHALSEMAEVKRSEVPQKSFMISQNYPNPFNPSTTIKFELPKSSEVNLSVYDIIGREVSVLVNERKEAGYHEVRFDGSGLSSGVYFYRLQAGDFVASEKMLVLK